MVQELSLNTLDLSSQKSKASVGRSASRRPPTRRRQDPTASPPLNGNSPLRNAHTTAVTNLHRVSRLCHQIHDSAVRQAFGRRSPPRPPIDERQSGDGSVEIYEIESVSSDTNKSHTNLSRTKSTSSEDVLLNAEDSSTKSIEDLEDLEQLQSWRRTSKIRRSLQFPKPNKPTPAKPLDLPENSVSVKKIKEDLEKGRRLNTALRGNNIDLEALDQILQSISSSSSIHSDKTTEDNLEDEEVKLITSKKLEKRDSFVTVESLQAVRGRLRRTSSPSSDIYSNKDEEIDDGIVTEEKQLEMPYQDKSPSKVRSYVFGMESLLNKKPVLGTGSLESRSKLVTANSSNRNEDWYNRRKSYGFEKVHSHEDSTISHKTKNFVESSTDSGICRSSEIVVVPTATKSTYDDNSSDATNSDNEKKPYVTKENGINFGNVRKMTNLFNKEDVKFYNNKAYEENNWTKRASYNEEWKPKSTTITIPIVNNKNNIIDLTWNDQPEKDIKRHSIAVDEAKYASKNLDNSFKRTSLAINDHTDDDTNFNRKTKKVEFCKTEVHFAADSGKVNIVETDEKPPPTNNFRRRRRNSGPIVSLAEDYNRNGLPVLHFGDTSYEKTMFGVDDDEKSLYENLHSRVPPAFGVVTVNTNINHFDYVNDKKDLSENENIRGILKNKPVKPKPYHLGEIVPFSELNSDDENKKWGVRLRPVKKEEPPVWKSTVSVQNSVYEDRSHYGKENDQPEFQKLLKNLRPTKKDLSDSETNFSDTGYSGIRVTSDNRRSSWSVSDKTVDESQKEPKGFSTKVNFGNGEATVVKSDAFMDTRHPSWSGADNSKEPRQLLNKGLVVRIGKSDSATNHMVCSKMTTTQDRHNTTTTTKITIDLSPSPPTTQQDKQPIFAYAKYDRSQNHNFKSTSLILNTIKDNNEAETKIPQQLEALKRLYEDEQSDSDADKEVQQLMSKVNDMGKLEDDHSSIVSGSWSKLSAQKRLHSYKNGANEPYSRYDLNTTNAKIEKDSSMDSLKTAQSTNKTSIIRNKFSPIVIRKVAPAIRSDLKSAMPTETLSSPSLVGRKVNGFDYPEKLEKTNYNGRQSPAKIVNGRQSPAKPMVNGRKSPTKPISNGRLTPTRLVQGRSSPVKQNRNSPTKDFKTISDSKLQTKHVNDMVLRQPKKSEMTYFGVNVSPKPIKRAETVIPKENKLSEKPDLLQHYNKSNEAQIRVVKPRRKSPEVKKESPIYENVNGVKRNKYAAKDFDNNILDELTKAADQILQAVNGYTDEEAKNRLTSDDDHKALETISETKSWKKETLSSLNKTKPPNSKAKLKHTSSNSSIDSVTKDRRRVSTVEKRSTPSKVSLEKPKKKPMAEVIMTKSTTKARRLQRASSREALLQSHGSSSEDLSINVEAPVRKPRLVKKTKAMQLTVTNGLEMHKKPTGYRRKETENSKVEERVLNSLPEIRHKTAVSTIRSTAEKSSRDRTRSRTEEAKKRSPPKREVMKSVNSSSSRAESRSRSSASTKEAVTTHRTTTAYVPVCSDRRRNMHAVQADDCPCLCS
ncbi:unnamed protein product [Brassicogethes aeneus]|uniref:Uncharacterized protein n=1 Tax=Brassicogethes aeneus TaxID=1431903 RepID=A0A9P0B5V1_BRAAE|nr:unnamed protein product [Brassicogethes aeneus]